MSSLDFRTKVNLEFTFEDKIKPMNQHLKEHLQKVFTKNAQAEWDKVNDWLNKHTSVTSAKVVALPSPTDLFIPSYKELPNVITISNDISPESKSAIADSNFLGTIDGVLLTDDIGVAKMYGTHIYRVDSGELKPQSLGNGIYSLPIGTEVKLTKADYEDKMQRLADNGESK